MEFSATSSSSRRMNFCELQKGNSLCNCGRSRNDLVHFKKSSLRQFSMESKIENERLIDLEWRKYQGRRHVEVGVSWRWQNECRSALRKWQGLRRWRGVAIAAGLWKFSEHRLRWRRRRRNLESPENGCCYNTSFSQQHNSNIIVLVIISSSAHDNFPS